MSEELFPLFLRLTGRPVLVVGGGRVAAGKVFALLEAGARVTVVAPEVRMEILASGAAVERRPFAPGDVDGTWLVVAAATPAVNREVARAAEARRVFANAVDDPPSASAFAAGVVRRGGATVAVSTGGRAPALAGLLREALAALLPEELSQWLATAQRLRAEQRARQVPMEARRPLLLVALERLYHPAPPTPPLSPAESGRASGASAAGGGPLPVSLRGGAGRGEGGARRTGFVSLVGAGPGDPGLLTLRAARALADAELVLYDALVPPEILALAPSARRFFVGKRAGRPSIRQEAIHRLLVASARAGRRVARLKAGDPFVFGRGGEEALALARAGIPFEVIPGISSALAAPALAGIPVTHRGLSSGFAVLSGHDPSAWAPVVEALPPGAVTLVFLMGLGARADIAARLQARGWPGATPAAALLGASTPSSSSWVGTLAGLGSTELAGEGAPGTLLVGRVAALAAEIGPQSHREPALASGR